MIPDLVPFEKSVALLLDPDKASGKVFENIIEIAVSFKADYILTGGSITFNKIDYFINCIKNRCTIPVILFPGSLLQLTTKADGIYFLSLISGRNPEMLIGNHVIAAPYLREIKDRVVPVGYMLISCGSRTSVEYMSQTEPIPPDKTDIIIATALAGEMLGMKMVYLEGGSGAKSPVPASVIRAVKENVSIPVIVGGGLKNAKHVQDAFESGADMIVIGNGCEKRPALLAEACKVRDLFRTGTTI
ncbi:MAG TPA: geranylgeranylglyceryl/heptaprenylglyceryl phosphate synthase [Bacteroidales bacterium]|nr:geranylgeranylglyceryl/heptaprenylglyceryl phosphate synthase [Bacteroidales bacterium]HOU96724.1 geranylgeranylglyceryl/heptaprenylglyceryl phosphate synthase [Bacteroidales bacterium]HQG35849.1 geranylgeranylglyceryl/heptaprenylglyceryl phosphate synthase [Bacteroidales bacterium]HQG52359.1 geranylgeranylglyceryl/heptaprenylglyceryl phosphate synthase [Bacteroidales bacterium]HQJ20142.1 geranylgeranylglyceryl/heptaprenylglyceryl phosphate synthase [Bacteroidales bacterium]